VRGSGYDTGSASHPLCLGTPIDHLACPGDAGPGRSWRFANELLRSIRRCSSPWPPSVAGSLPPARSRHGTRRSILIPRARRHRARMLDRDARDTERESPSTGPRQPTRGGRGRAETRAVASTGDPSLTCLAWSIFSYPHGCGRWPPLSRDPWRKRAGGSRFVAARGGAAGTAAPLSREETRKRETSPTRAGSSG
jgi:hypothetical protein